MQKDFAPRNMTSGGTSGGVLKNFSRLTITCHIYGPSEIMT